MEQLSDLLPTQRNELAKVFQRSGCVAKEFQWSYSTPDPIKIPYGNSQIHLKTGFYFHYYMVEKACVIHQTPGQSTVKEGWKVAHFSELVECYAAWLTCLKRETSAPDLWADLASQTTEVPLFGNFESTNNTPFTPPELEAIDSGIEKLKSFIAEKFAEQDEKFEAMKIHLERMKASAHGGIGRIDWKNQLVGCIIQVLLFFAASPSQASLVFGYIGSLFGAGVRFLTTFL